MGNQLPVNQRVQGNHQAADEHQKLAPKVCLWLPLVGDHEQEGGRGSLPPFDKLMIIRSRRREIKL